MEGGRNDEGGFLRIWRGKGGGKGEAGGERG